MLRRTVLLALVIAASGLFQTTTAEAQGQFSPEIQVGPSIITRYQVDQRTQFLSLLNAPGDVRELAREQLINETLQLAAAEAEGIEVTQEQIEAGIAEFASRANLTGEQFLTITGNAGISEATIRDFIIAGVAWREAVRSKFAEEARGSITPDQVRRSLAQTGTEGGLRVLVSEILLPADTPETARASRERATELSRLPDEAAFAAAARQFSVAASARRGGELNWVALDALPEEVRGIIDRLTPGQISRPVTLENAIGVFLLRDEERVPAGTPATLSVDYALFIVPGGASEAAEIAARADVCEDLFGIAKGLPEERLIRETRPVSEVPPDIRQALNGLDENETTTALTRGGNATVLMLCERRSGVESTVDSEIVGNRLLNVRLSTAASHYLAELRANTEIVDFTAN